MRRIIAAAMRLGRNPRIFAIMSCKGSNSPPRARALRIMGKKRSKTRKKTISPMVWLIGISALSRPVLLLSPSSTLADCSTLTTIFLSNVAMIQAMTARTRAAKSFGIYANTTFKN